MSSKELYLHFSKPTITEKLKLQRAVVTEILGVLLSIAVWKEHCVEQVDSADIIYVAVRVIVFVSFFSAIACQQFDSVEQVHVISSALKVSVHIAWHGHSDPACDVVGDADAIVAFGPPSRVPGESESLARALKRLRMRQDLKKSRGLEETD